MFFAPVTFTSLTDMGMDIWSAICWTLAGRVTARDSLFSYHLRNPAFLCLLFRILELRRRPCMVQDILRVGLELVERSRPGLLKMSN